MNGKESRISIIQAYLVTRENVIINLQGYLFAELVDSYSTNFASSKFES
jgi:hypothetical protein